MFLNNAIIASLIDHISWVCYQLQQELFTIPCTITGSQLAMSFSRSSNPYNIIKLKANTLATTESLEGLPCLLDFVLCALGTHDRLTQANVIGKCVSLGLFGIRGEV